MLSEARFLQSIFSFSQNEKDFINDETVELMAPYLDLEGFNAAVARNASKALEGLCIWCRAMTQYHEASKVIDFGIEYVMKKTVFPEEGGRRSYVSFDYTKVGPAYPWISP